MIEKKKKGPEVVYREINRKTQRKFTPGEKMALKIFLNV